MSSLPSRLLDVDVRMALLKANGGIEVAMAKFRELDSSTRLLGLVTLAPLILYSVFAIYNIYFHPLRHFPGPRAWAAGRVPFLWSFVRGYTILDTTELHRRYGPIVRVMPNQLSCASATSFAQVLLHPKGAQKPFVQRDLTWFEPPPGLSTTLFDVQSATEHRRLRGLWLNAFSPGALVAQEPILQTYARMMVRRLHEVVFAADPAAANGDPADDWRTVDITPWLNYSTFDLFGALAFGEDIGALRHARYPEWLAITLHLTKVVTYNIGMRLGIGFGLDTLTPGYVPAPLRANREHMRESVKRRLHEGAADRPDFMEHVIRSTAGGTKGITQEQINAHFEILMFAGSETTATVMTGTLLQLSTHPNIRDAVTKEIREAFPTEADIGLRRLQELPIFNAVIKEGLRLCPAVPALNGRRSPKEGGMVEEMFVPGNTHMIMNVYALSRDPNLFHQADQFFPERWLPAAREKASPFSGDKLESVLPFSQGPRNCLGISMAWAQLRMFLGHTLWAYDLSAAREPFAWEKIRSFIVVEKRPVEMRLRPRLD